MRTVKGGREGRKEKGEQRLRQGGPSISWIYHSGLYSLK